MINWCRNIAENPSFQNFIIGLIICNAVLLGLETEPYIHREFGWLVDVTELVILAIFTFEIGVRLLAYAPAVLDFFKDAWNVFDFAVVAISLLPAVGPLGAIARLIRVLRVLRLLAFSRQLRLIIDTLLRSIPSMGHVVLLLSIIVYTYAIIGITLFHDPNDHSPEWKAMWEQRWGNAIVACWTMFQTLTFENWVGLQDPLMRKYWWTPLFFGSFIMMGVFVAMNLFVAVVMSHLEDVKAEQRAESHAHDTYTQLIDYLEKIKGQMNEFESALQGLRNAPPS